ncbi:hypothetical protein MUK42_06368 [Musa troglodytarum]|uniref:Uncharacterized protein n=1 Tax=Musa troglodytarum TaxID=320322 RepID=A0A9E7GHV9_9LILI|nr:hypothetical protein MUK42_06368 [Musa troglodytarum]
MRPGRDARIRARLIETLGSGWNPGILPSLLRRAAI